MSVHGDDFTTVGPKCELDKFEALLEEKYELKKGGQIGPGKDDAKEFTVLNRMLRWTDSGIEYEADPRQGERLLEEGLVWTTAARRRRRLGSSRLLISLSKTS